MRWRVEASAQWASSITRSRGWSAASESSPATTEANSSARSTPSPGADEGQGRSGPRAGKRAASSSRSPSSSGGECLGERLVGRCAVAEVEAVAGQHAVAGGARPCAELTQQPGLADAGVAADQHDVASIGVGHAGGLEQLLELADTSDEGCRGRPVVGHVVNHVGLDRQRDDGHTCAVRPTVMLTRRTTRPRRALRVRRGANPVRSRSWREISDRARAAAWWRLTSRGTNCSGLRIMSPESSYEVAPHIGRVT